LMVRILFYENEWKRENRPLPDSSVAVEHMKTFSCVRVATSAIFYENKTNEN
jgi:hypothetical protein